MGGGTLTSPQTGSPSRLANLAAVALTLVLVVALGGIAFRRVADRWQSRVGDVVSITDGQTANGPGPADDVALVGDSITEQSEATFHATLEPEYHLRVRGRGGYRIEEMEPYAIELATAKPEQVIINLGTNDVLDDWPVDKAVTALNRMIKDFAGARCLHLVTINESFYNEKLPDLGQRAAVFNLELRRIATANRIDVIDWSAAVIADGTDNSAGPITSDTVHPTERGRKVLSDLYRTALDKCR